MQHFDPPMPWDIYMYIVEVSVHKNCGSLKSCCFSLACVGVHELVASHGNYIGMVDNIIFLVQPTFFLSLKTVVLWHPIRQVGSFKLFSVVHVVLPSSELLFVVVGYGQQASSVARDF